MYLDTSVLVAYYCPEVMSDQVESLIRSQSSPFVSELTEVEFSSAVARKVREGGLVRADALRILTEFTTHLDAGYYSRLTVEPRHYRLAKDWLGQMRWPMKSLDALHVATAAIARTILATADVSLSAVAQALGIDTVLLSPEAKRRRR